MEKESKMAKMQLGEDKKVPAPLSTADMVLDAIEKTDDAKNGVSLQAIKKYISNEYSVDMDRHGPRIRKYIKKALDTGILIQVKGRGAKGSFKKGDGKPKTTSKAIQKMTEKKVTAGAKSKIKKVVATTEGGTEQTSAPETSHKKMEKKSEADLSGKKMPKVKDADSSKKKMTMAKKNDAGPSEKKRAKKNDEGPSEKKRTKKKDDDSSEKKHEVGSVEQKPTSASDDHSKNPQEDEDKVAAKEPAKSVKAKFLKRPLTSAPRRRN